jgi:hypothetical protein
MMIHVQNAVRQAQVRQDMEKANGVGASGNGDGDPPPAGEHRIPGHRGEDAVLQGTSILARGRAAGRTVL